MAEHLLNVLELLTKDFPRLLRQDVSERIDKRNARDGELEDLASLPYYERITQFARGSTRHWVEDSTTVVDFRPLYALTMHNIQRQLLQEMHIFSAANLTDEQLERIRNLLERYSNPFLRPDRTLQG
jgi:hypothetical protein